MILVTVGTHNQGFERLVRAADEMAALIDEPVVIQYGSASYVPRYANRSFRFTSSQEMEALTRDASVIVTHAAAGSIILAINLGKSLVLVPRVKKYNEHIDDHQNQLARALAKQGQAVKVDEPSGPILSQAVEQATSLPMMESSKQALTQSLHSLLECWQNNQRKQ